MYRNRKLVRENGIRVYLNDVEQKEIEEGAEIANSERATFMRDASLVVARYLKRLSDQNRTPTSALADIQARLGNDFRYCLA